MIKPEKITVTCSEKWREDVVRVARAWIGTPYHHRAKVKGAGVDCGMILQAVFSEAGVINDYDTGEYPPDWMMHRSQELYLCAVEQYAKKVNREPLPGDVALFRFGRCISHGAIVTDWPFVVHAYKDARMVVEDNIFTSDALHSRLVGFWSVEF